MPSRHSRTTSPSPQPRPRTGIFHRQSTRLRSNVADQVQRDLLPAGRMLSVFLILCELLAEVLVLISSRGQDCDRPLRLWVYVLIVLQTGTVVLNCLNICHGHARDSFGQHRNGLSATEIDMYTDAPAAPVRSPPSRSSPSSPSSPSSSPSPSPAPDQFPNDPSPHQTLLLVDPANPSPRSLSSAPVPQYDGVETRPLLYSHSSHSHSSFPHSSNPTSPSASSDPHIRTTAPSDPLATSPAPADTSPTLSASSLAPFVSSEFVDRYIRFVNAWYLLWFILGSYYVSGTGTCATTAPHLYRLVVALTIIYYALLFLPLACFCLIVCCLPLFILVYRIMLPYAERERRRARAADPAHVQSLSSIVYSQEAFRAHTGDEDLDDARCVICLCDYEPNEVIRFLPCKHHFHKDCVDEWLRLDKACCLCKQDIDAQTSPTPISPV